MEYFNLMQIGPWTKNKNTIAKSFSTVKNRFFRDQIKQIKVILSHSIVICISTKEFKVIQEYYKFGETCQTSLIFREKAMKVFIKSHDLEYLEFHLYNIASPVLTSN